MTQPEVKVNEWLTEGFNLYKENLGLLVLASLVAIVLASVTFGILAGPMFAGLYMIALALVDRKTPKPQVGDLFKGFSFFLQTFLFVLVFGLGLGILSIILNLIPLLGQLASLCLSFGAQALLMFALLLIVDQGMDFWPAAMASINMVKTNFWPFVGFGVLAAVFGFLGSLACGIGMIFTLPIQVCMITVAYREVFANGVPTEVEEAAETDPWGRPYDSPSEDASTDVSEEPSDDK